MMMDCLLSEWQRSVDDWWFQWQKQKERWAHAAAAAVVAAFEIVASASTSNWQTSVRQQAPSAGRNDCQTPTAVVAVVVEPRD